MLSFTVAKKLINTLVYFCIDDCNAFLAGVSKTTINKVQHFQNSAARVLTGSRTREHISPILESLHWLPVRFRIDFKILNSCDFQKMTIKLKFQRNSQFKSEWLPEAQACQHFYCLFLFLKYLSSNVPPQLFVSIEITSTNEENLCLSIDFMPSLRIWRQVDV